MTAENSLFSCDGVRGFGGCRIDTQNHAFASPAMCGSACDDSCNQGCARGRAHRRGPAMRETRVDGSLGCGCPVLEFGIFINLNLAVVFPADARKRDAGR